MLGLGAQNFLLPEFIENVEVETGVGFGLHKGKEQMALLRVEEKLAIVGMTVGLPLAGDEVADGVTVVRTLEEELQLFGLLDVYGGIVLYATNAHVERCGAILAIIGYILLGLGVNLADTLYLLSFGLAR